MMDKQLTSLAREYGEYVANSLDYDMYPDPGLGYRLVVKGYSEAAQLVLEWLSTRFCLVEKSRIQEEYQKAQTQIKDGKELGIHVLVTLGGAKEALLESLFPEIAKEVEG